MRKVRPSRKVKGMTLIEVIISMLVFGVMGTIMVGICTVSTTMIKETNHLNNKTDAEAPIAAVRDVDALKAPDDSFIDATDNEGNAITIEESIIVTVRSNAGASYGAYDFNKYSTASAGEAANNAKTNMNGNLEFYVRTP